MDDDILVKIHPHCYVVPTKVSAVFQQPLDTHTNLIIDGMRVSVEAPIQDVLDALGRYLTLPD